VGEENKNLNHDRLFKHLLHLFLDDFLKCFYLDFYYKINWTSDTKSISEDTDSPKLDIRNSTHRYVDKLQEVYLIGEDKPTYLHFENQSYRQPEFPRRVYEYNCLIRSKFQERSVYSFSICFKDYPNKKEQNKYEYNSAIGLEPNTFYFNEIHLKNYYWNDEELSVHPITWALAPLMKKKRSDTPKNIMVKCLQNVREKYYTIEEDKANCIILFLDYYFKPDEQTVSEVLDRVYELVTEGEDDIMKTITRSFNGASQTRAKVEVLERVVRKKFFSNKEIPDEIQQHINLIEDKQKAEDAVAELSMVDTGDMDSLKRELQRAYM